MIIYREFGIFRRSRPHLSAWPHALSIFTIIILCIVIKLAPITEEALNFFLLYFSWAVDFVWINTRFLFWNHARAVRTLTTFAFLYNKWWHPWRMPSAVVWKKVPVWLSSNIALTDLLYSDSSCKFSNHSPLCQILSNAFKSWWNCGRDPTGSVDIFLSGDRGGETETVKQRDSETEGQKRKSWLKGFSLKRPPSLK